MEREAATATQLHVCIFTRIKAGANTCVCVHSSYKPLPTPHPVAILPTCVEKEVQKKRRHTARTSHTRHLIRACAVSIALLSFSSSFSFI